jgi:hypothetical protein
VNEPFLDSISEIVQHMHHNTRKIQLIRGSIKKPDRALQKLVRVYNRDPGSLTDIVRCTVIVGSLQDAAEFMTHVEARSHVGVRDSVHVWEHEYEPRLCDTDWTFDRGHVCGEGGRVVKKTMCITKLHNRYVCAGVCVCVCVCMDIVEEGKW